MWKWSDFVDGGVIPIELTRERPILALYGEYQVGKSTFLNCLLGHYIALAGKGLSTTSLVSRYRYGQDNTLRYRTKPDSPFEGELKVTTIDEVRKKTFLDQVDMSSGFHLEVETPVELLRSCDIVDTPGYNASERDNLTAINTLGHIHYILFVIQNRGLSQLERELILKLFRMDIPFSIIMNCSIGRREERWIPEHEINQNFLDECENWLSAMKIQPMPIAGKKVFICNVLFYWSQMPDFVSSMPDIDRPDTVQKHILQTLKEEGYQADRETILELSGVRRLVQALSERIDRYDPVTHKWEI